jgi:hypothetical protein
MNMLDFQSKHLFLFILIVLISCLKVDTDQDLRIEKSNLELAFPLFHSSMNIEELAKSVNAESSISIDENDKITLLYRGAVVEGNSNQVFPPPIGLLDIEIPDTVYTYAMPITYWQEINTLTMGPTNLEFKFYDERTDQVKINVEINEMTKDGQPFEINLTMENGSVVSQQYSVEDYIVIPTDNALTIRYTAITNNGEFIKLDKAVFNFDVFQIKYIEGIFSPRSIDVQGDVISVGILENWKSGGLTFLNPELYLKVENSFGIQAFSQNSEIEIETTDGQFLPLESQLLVDGIDFAYPALNERGKVKITEVVFNKANSNLEDLFSGKASKINYDINALINNQNSMQPGFISEEGYFRIEAVARLPLDLTIDNLVLEESAIFDGSRLEDIYSATINWSFRNEFPVDMQAQAYLFKNSTLIDSLFSEIPMISGAEITNGTQTIASEQLLTIDYSNYQVNSIQSADSIQVIAWFDTKDALGIVHLSNNHRFQIDAGILAKIK